MSELIQQARELCEKATPGPWEYRDNGFDGVIYGADDTRIVGGEPCEGRIEPGPDAQFIAASRTLVPQLCDALEAAQKEIELLKTQCDINATSFFEMRNMEKEATARVEKAEANASHLINQVEEYKQKFNAALVRAEKAEAERETLHQTLDMYGGEEGITAALKERDTYKAALQNWNGQEGAE